VHRNSLIRSIGTNTLLNILGQTIPVCIAIFAIPIAISGLGEARFGILSIAWIIIGTSSFFDLGLGRATTKFSAEALQEKNLARLSKIVGSAALSQLVIGVVIGLGFHQFSPSIVRELFDVSTTLEEESIQAIRMAGYSVPIAMIYGSYKGVLEASNRFDIVNWIRVLSSSLTYGLLILGSLLKADVGEIVGWLLVLRIFQLIAVHWACRLIYPILGWIPVFNKEQLNKMFSFGGWVAASNIIGPIQENLERLILASTMPIAMVTYYSVPKDLLDRLSIIPGSLASAIFPIVSAFKQQDVAKYLQFFHGSIRTISVAVGGLLLIIILAADQILLLWIDQNFATQSSQVLVVLAFGVMASSLNGISVTLFHGMGRPKLVTLQQLIRLPIICTVSWYLVQHFGVIGAAYGWTFARILAVLTNFMALKLTIACPIKELLPGNIIISVLILPISVFVFLLIQPIVVEGGLLSSLSGLVIAVLLFLFVHWLVVLSSVEKEWLKSRVLRGRL